MASVDPISDALVSLVELNASRREAEIRLDRAKAKETAGGRTAVPNVLAELQKRAEKKAKDAEKIQAQGRAGQQGTAAAGKALTPPLIDVTGAEVLQDLFGGRQAASGATGQGAPQTGGARPPVGAGPGPSSTTAVNPTDPEPFLDVLLRGGGNALRPGLGSNFFPRPTPSTTTTQTLSPDQQRLRVQEMADAQAQALVPHLEELQDRQGTPESGELGQDVVDFIAAVQQQFGPEVAEQMVRLGLSKTLKKQQSDREKATERFLAEQAAIRKEGRQEKKQRTATDVTRDLEAQILQDVARGQETTTFIDARGEEVTLNEAQREVFLQEKSKMDFGDIQLRHLTNEQRAAMGLAGGGASPGFDPMNDPEVQNAPDDVVDRSFSSLGFDPDAEMTPEKDAALAAEIRRQLDLRALAAESQGQAQPEPQPQPQQQPLPPLSGAEPQPAAQGGGFIDSLRRRVDPDAALRQRFPGVP
jgi:hypothetical protein